MSADPQDEKKNAGRYPQYCWCEEASGLMRDVLKRMGPPKEARRHFEQAHVEFLKGVRSLLDARIQRMETAPETPKGSSIPVD